MYSGIWRKAHRRFSEFARRYDADISLHTVQAFAKSLLDNLAGSLCINNVHRLYQSALFGRCTCRFRMHALHLQGKQQTLFQIEIDFWTFGRLDC